MTEEKNTSTGVPCNTDGCKNIEAITIVSQFLHPFALYLKYDVKSYLNTPSGSSRKDPELF